MNIGKLMTVLRQLTAILTLLSEIAQRLEEDKLKSNLGLNESPSNGIDRTS